MKIILFSLFLLSVASLVPNCAYEANNRCLSCYYGFQLASGRCDKCSTGFVMMNEVCISQGIYQQQQALNQQLAASTATTSSSTLQKTQGFSGFSTGATSVLQTQTAQGAQGINTVQAVTQSSNNVATSGASLNSNIAIFEIGNTGVMYLLNLFGLVGNIPVNCVAFTPDFKCVRCGNGFNLLNGVCALQITTTTATNIFGTSLTSGNAGIFGSSTNSQSTATNSGSMVNSGSGFNSGSSATSNSGSSSLTNSGSSATSNSGSSSVNSGSAFNSGSSFSSFGSQSSASAVANSDPNCQTASADGSCSQCYFSYFYSPETRRCMTVNPQCATWNILGNCLTCYQGYRIHGTGCLIESHASVSSQSTSQSSSSGQFSGQSSQTTQSNTQTSQQQSSQGSSASSVGNFGASSTSSSSISGGALLISSDSNCKTSGLGGVCSECYYSYFVNPSSGLCVPVNPQCQTWNNFGHCLSCYSGYVITGTTCLIGSTGSTVSSGSSSASTSPSGLAQGGSANFGNSVIFGTGSNSLSGSASGTSNGSTSGASSGSGQWNSGASNVGIFGSSGSGSSGSFASSGSSSSSIITGSVMGSDPNCRTPNPDGSCSICYNSFYYDSISARRCVSVNPLCQTWNNLGHCLSCYRGYNLFNNNCVIENAFQVSLTVDSNDLPSSNQDPYCNVYKDGVCAKCATRTYFDAASRRCLQVDSNCRSWTDSGICTGCYDGYFIFNQRECRLIYPEVNTVQMKSSLNSDVNCRASNASGTCTQCIWRFVLGPSRVCIKVKDLCKQWNESTAWCTECYGGYSLTNNGECRVSL